MVYVPFTLTFTMRPSNITNENVIEDNQIRAYFSNLSNETNWNAFNQQLTSTQYRPEPLPQYPHSDLLVNPQSFPTDQINLLSLSQYRPSNYLPQPSLIAPPGVIYPLPQHPLSFPPTIIYSGPLSMQPTPLSILPPIYKGKLIL